jgi:hypothetical protein
MNVTINNEALAKALGKTAGAVVDVKCKNGVPVDKYWRGRLKDAEIDGCVSILGKKKEKATQEAK